MGIAISLYDLAVASGNASLISTISSVALDQFTRKRLLNAGEEVKDVRPGRMDFVEATRREISDTKRDGGITAINIMCALARYYEMSVKGAVEGGVDIIITGAGMPIHFQEGEITNHSVDLPFLVEKYAGKNHNIKLVPITSSRPIFEKIYRIWEREGHPPDAVAVEGPKAGGHIGWSYKRIERAGNDFLKKYDLFDVLLPEVLEAANKDGRNVPVIAAGGIYSHDDIVHALDIGASAVQMGTRFAATHESGGSEGFKQAYVDAKESDVVIATLEWGSPCNFPFRYLKDSSLAQEKIGNHFCICPGLFVAAGLNSDKKGNCPEGYVLTDKGPCLATGNSSYKGIYTCGTEVHRINEVVSVAELVDELVG
jgi:nitronate monooxygenase